MNGRIALRIAGWGIALVVVALPLVALLNGWLAADRWPVRSLRIQAELGHVSAEQVRSTAAPLLETGFFAVDLERVQNAVAALPWVAQAEVRKRWPDEVLIRIREQQPFAHWNGDRLINRKGRTFVVPGAADLQGLPQLHGPQHATDRVLAFYLDAREALGRRNLGVRGVRLSARGSWLIELDGGARIMVGHDRAEARLARFLATWPQLAASKNVPPVYIDLRYSNGYAVRWSDSPAEPGVTPRA